MNMGGALLGQAVDFDRDFVLPVQIIGLVGLSALSPSLLEKTTR